MFDVQVNERGQITIPKELRDKANINPKDNLLVKMDDQGRLILVKKDIFNNLEDLIIKDLKNQGYAEKDIPEKITERKKDLAKALLKMVEEGKNEIDNGHYSTLNDLKDELKEGDF